MVSLPGVRSPPGLIMSLTMPVPSRAKMAAVRVAARVAMSFGRDLRGELFHRVTGFSAQDVASFGASSLITRITNDVTQVQMLVLLTCTLMVSAPIMCVGGIIMALREDLGLAWLIVVSVTMDTVSQVQGHLLAQQYEGLIKKSKLRGNKR